MHALSYDVNDAMMPGSDLDVHYQWTKGKTISLVDLRVLSASSSTLGGRPVH